MDERARTLLKTLVEHYIADGQPVGSRALSKFSGLDLSPATIRNVMADLEEAGEQVRQARPRGLRCGFQARHQDLLAPRFHRHAQRGLHSVAVGLAGDLQAIAIVPDSRPACAINNRALLGDVVDNWRVSPSRLALRLELMLKDSLTEGWDIARMAAALHLSERQLHRLCQQHFALAPMALLQRLRLQRAALLLASRADSVKLLAAQCGFKNEYHFSTAFKRQHGLAPSHYRRLHHPAFKGR